MKYLLWGMRYHPAKFHYIAYWVVATAAILSNEGLSFAWTIGIIAFYSLLWSGLYVYTSYSVGRANAKDVEKEGEQG